MFQALARRGFVVLLLAVMGIAAWGLAVADDPAPSGKAPPGMTLPEYNEAGDLLRPEGYERWTLVGTSLGLDYSPGAKRDDSRPGMFHNVYMQPEAFDHFVKTGVFAEQTIFVVTNNPAAKRPENDEIHRHGHFAAPTVGLEVSVLDTKRYEDGWGFFLYLGSPKKRPASKPLPTHECFECHAQHGEDNGVFLQFYSVLKTARQRELAASKQ